LSEEAEDVPETVEIDNAGSVEGITKKRKRAKRASDKAEEFWKGVLSTETGRREMWNLVAGTHAFEDRFLCGPNGFPQPEATWYEAGKRDWGQGFFHMLVKYDRAGSFLMLDEHDPRFAKPKHVKENTGD
jgi:hypothetical protein